MKIERFSFECRKVIGFALSTRCDWLKRFAPPFHPIRSKTKANCDALARFSRALRQPHVITSSFDWFNVLSVSYVIGQSNYFGFGFTTLKRKPLYSSANSCCRRRFICRERGETSRRHSRAQEEKFRGGAS